MGEEISFGGLTAAKGEKKSGWAPVAGTDIQMPLTIVNGARPGKTILITSGIHGGEYPCIACAIELAQTIDPAQVSGQVIIFHPVNYEAFIQRRAYIVPADGKNLNRQFPGDPNGTVSQKIAYALENEYIMKSDFHIDMHGGDIPESLPPYVYFAGVGDESVVQQAEAVAKTMHVNFMVRSTATTGMYNYSTIKSIPAVLIETGGRGLWSREEVDLYMLNVTNALKQLGVLPGAPKMPEKQGHIIKRANYIDANFDGCWYPCVALEEEVKAGQLLGVIKDVFGNVLEEIRAEFDSMIVFKAVSLAIQKGEAILTYGI